MGNCCGKASSSNFAGEGRTLTSSAPPRTENARATIPPQQKMGQGQSAPVVGGKGRTLGGEPGSEGQDDAKARAAKAAEVSVGIHVFKDCYLLPSSWLLWEYSYNHKNPLIIRVAVSL